MNPYHMPEPEKVQPPGFTIETRLAVLMMNRDEFAEAMGHTRETVDDIIDGRLYRLDQNYRKAVEGK